MGSIRVLDPQTVNKIAAGEVVERQEMLKEIWGVENEPHNRSVDNHIVDMVIRIAHGVGLTVVAEGVETEAQAAALLELGCGRAQGYLFARPFAADSVGALLGR